MATYKQLFFLRFANDRGNIRKGVSAEEVWSSLEEFLRLVLAPKLKVSKRKTTKVNNDLTNSPFGKIPKSATALRFKQVSNPLDDEGQVKKVRAKKTKNEI